MDLISIYAKQLGEILQGKLTKEEIYQLIEVPKNQLLGDLAFPCFRLAKTERKSPIEIAKQLSGEIQAKEFIKVEAIGGYVNITFSPKELGQSIVTKILRKEADYGQSNIGNEKTVALDMSSPNIAKPFSMGHLRSTVIGSAIANLAIKCGYHTVKINHIGDWGTQFGKLIVAYQKWGNEEQVKMNPIGELFKLYVKFHKEVEQEPQLEDEGRAAFKKLECGDEQYLNLWEWFRRESLRAFMTIYDLLGVEFDSFQGEAFYNDKMEEIIHLLSEHKLLEVSEGAEVVRLDEYEIPPCLIKKSDGATLYATRDLAAALYRSQEYKFDEALYVVGQEQAIHFQQVKAVLKKLGYDWAEQMKHIPFGLYLQDGKKMSTRKGRVILLEAVLNEAINLAKRNILEKNPKIPNADEVANAVGVGAIIFHDLKNDRMNNIEFSLEEMLTFEGETGPYVQYTNARANSILRKYSKDQFEFSGLTDIESWDIVKLLNQFPDVIEKSYKQYSPSILAKYLIQISQSFNKYYARVRILEEGDSLVSRVSLVKAVTIVLTEGLRLLGIKAPKEM
ncbi:arginine--tRNA ligase 1 [Heyndrickxia sporothermodurans]|nr:arginine--tRNA ligase 1 [Heyndrickxia sporothermodurans]